MKRSTGGAAVIAYMQTRYFPWEPLMSYSFSVTVSKLPELNAFRNALGIPDLCCMEIDLDDASRAASDADWKGPLHFYRDQISNRGIEVSCSGLTVGVRILTLSAMQDYDLAFCFVEALARLENSAIKPEDCASLSVDQLRQRFDRNWCLAQNGAGFRAMTATIKADPNKSITIPGIKREYAMNQALLTTLSATGSGTLIDRFIEAMRAEQYKEPEFDWSSVEGQQMTAMFEKFAEVATDLVIKGRTPDAIKRTIIESGAPEDLADTLVEMVGAAGTAAAELRRGRPEIEVFDQLKVPQNMRPMVRRMIEGINRSIDRHPFDTVAANPGSIEIQSVQFLRTNLDLLAVLAVVLLVPSAACAAIGHYWWEPMYLFAVGGAALFLWLVHKSWEMTRLKFLHGNVCPGQVVSLDPCRVAVYTNLAHDGGVDYSVIKVFDGELNGRNYPAIKVGSRVAVVCTYKDGEEPDRWADVFPDAVNCFTNDQKAIERALKSIPEDQWDEVNVALSQVPSPKELGLYPVKVPEQTTA